MSLSTKEIKEILEILEASGWDEAEVTVGDVTLAVSKGSGDRRAAVPPTPTEEPEASEAPAPEEAPAPAPPAEPTADGAVTVGAPSVGIFWRAVEPGAPPFVEVGDPVEAGQVLCIVEVMKLMQHVAAEQAGVVTHIHAANGDAVEQDQPLFTLAPR